MIKIRKGDVYLKLGDSPNVDIEHTCALTKSGLSSREFSYPFEIPVEGNEKNLEFEFAIDGKGNEKNIPVYIEDGRLERKAILNVERYKYDLNKKTGIANCSLGGNDNAFYAAIKDKLLTELDLGKIEIPTYTPPSWATFDFGSPTGTTTAFSNVCHWAGKVTRGEIEADCVFPTYYAPDFQNYAVNDIVMDRWLPRGVINFWGTMQETYIMGPPPGFTVPLLYFPEDEYPPAHYYFTTDSPYNYGVYRQRLVPMFKLMRLLEKVFSALNYTLIGNCLNDEDYTKLFLFNNFSVNKWRTSTENIYSVPSQLAVMMSDLVFVDDACTEIVVANHVPTIKITDFIDSTLNLLGLKIDFKEGNVAQLQQLREPLSETENYKGAFILNPVYEKILDDDGSTAANNIEYSFSGNSDVGELTTTEKISVVHHEVELQSDLYDITDAKKNDIGLSLSNQKLFKWDGVSLWEDLGLNFTPQKDTDTIPIIFEPVDMRYSPLDATVIAGRTFPTPLEGYWLPQYFGQGSLFEIVDDTSSFDFPESTVSEFSSIVGIYYGLKQKPDDPTVYYPYAGHSNKSFGFGDYGNYSLGLLGEESIQKYFRGTWQELIRNAIPFIFTLLLQSNEKPKPMQFIFIEGHRFLITSVKHNTATPEIVQIQASKL
jgi:hypothetical protein